MGSAEYDLMKYDQQQCREAAYDEALEAETDAQIAKILAKPLEPEFSEAIENLMMPDTLTALAKLSLDIHNTERTQEKNALYQHLGCRLHQLIIEHVTPTAEWSAKQEIGEL